MRSRSLAIALLVFGSLGCAAAWILLADMTGRRCSWMAVVAALDAAVLLRLGRFPGGTVRACCGLLATAFIIAIANWGIAAIQIGRPLGLLPWESARKLGPELGWLLIQLGNGTADLAWLAVGLLAAVFASR